MSRIFSTLLLLASTSAFAAPDLSVSLVAPTSITVGAMASYTVNTKNVGNHTAYNAKVVIQLPKTNTSPTVHVLGDLGTMSTGCSLSGTKLTCLLGTIQKGKTKPATFQIALPRSAAPHTFIATGSSSPVDANPGNNTATYTASLQYLPLAISGPRAAHNNHCTGTGLISFFECTLYPSSISGHDTVFEAGGTITIVGEPAYTGTWSQSSPTNLTFSYFENGTLVATFVGNGVSNTTGAECFEGMTTFPGSPYVSPYEVCLQ